MKKEVFDKNFYDVHAITIANMFFNIDHHEEDKKITLDTFIKILNGADKSKLTKNAILCIIACTLLGQYGCGQETTINMPAALKYIIESDIETKNTEQKYLYEYILHTLEYLSEDNDYYNLIENIKGNCYDIEWYLLLKTIFEYDEGNKNYDKYCNYNLVLLINTKVNVYNNISETKSYIEEINELKIKIKKLEDENKQLKLMIDYAPDGIGYQDAKNDFECNAPHHK